MGPGGSTPHLSVMLGPSPHAPVACASVVRTALGFLETPDLGNEDGFMSRERSVGKPTTRRYSPEEKASAVRMVRTLRAELGTEHGTVQRVASQLAYGRLAHVFHATHVHRLSRAIDPTSRHCCWVGGARQFVRLTAEAFPAAGLCAPNEQESTRGVSGAEVRPTQTRCASPAAAWAIVNSRRVMSERKSLGERRWPRS